MAHRDGHAEHAHRIEIIFHELSRDVYGLGFVWALFNPSLHSTTTASRVPENYALFRPFVRGK